MVDKLKYSLAASYLLSEMKKAHKEKNYILFGIYLKEHMKVIEDYKKELYGENDD